MNKTFFGFGKGLKGLNLSKVEKTVDPSIVKKALALDRMANT